MKDLYPTVAEIRDIAAAIRDHLADLNTLADKREKHRLVVARSRASKSPVTSQEPVTSQKETESGKETLPPTPPIREKGKDKEKEQEKEKTRVRERDERIRRQRIAAVTAYNAEIDGNIDAEYFVDYYSERWPRDWQARLRNWLKGDKTTGRISPTALLKQASETKVYTAADWSLCAERCANCRGDRCARGIACPPDLDPDHTHPPEECSRFVVRDS